MALLVLASSAPALSAPNPSVLPDNRAWEIVSKPEKSGATIDPLGLGEQGPLGGMVQASEDGTSFTYAANAPVEHEPEGNRAPEGVQIISKRVTNSAGAPEWSSKDIITPHLHGEGLESGEPQEYRLFSNDLSSAIAWPYGRIPPNKEEPHSNFQEPPLAGSEPEERGIYLRHNAACEVLVKSPSCYQPLVSPENDTAKAPFGEHLGFVSASPDLSHVVIRSNVALTPQPAEYKLSEYLYEWSRESPSALHLLSPPPGSEAAGEPQLGSEKAGVFQNVRGAVSNGVSPSPGRPSVARAFWTTFEVSSDSRVFLFASDPESGVTIQVNRPEGKLAKKWSIARQRALEPELRFQAANVDGSRMFFTNSIPLTEEDEFAPKKEGPSDLYVCELPPMLEASSACRLKDLTIAPPNEKTGKKQSAEVIGTLTAMSEDGSTVAFVANAALAGQPSPNGETAAKGSCIRPNGNSEKRKATSLCNLYVEHYEGGKWQQPKLVARLSQEDENDWEKASNAETFLWSLTARLSPNGRYLAFMSQRSLTGYNNVDAKSGKPDMEVFLYDGNSSAEKLVCASCNPTGKQPTGVFDRVSAEGEEPSGLLVDPIGKVYNTEAEASVVPSQGRWLAGSIPGWTPLASTVAPRQSRFLLDNGRLYFNSADALVGPFEGQVTEREEWAEGKKTKVGVENVYQYEPSGVGTCAQANGCVSLISSGTSSGESAFLDASTSGNDAFFITGDQLVPADEDTNLDAYDARVCSEASPCVQPAAAAKEHCSGEACKPPPAPVPGFGAAGTSTLVAPGNVPRVETLNLKETKGITKAKAPTRAQLLAKALSSCRKKYKHAKKKRAACERQARKKYGKATHKGHKK